MVKKHKFKKTKDTNKAREDLKSLEELPLVGGLFKGLEKFIDLAEKVEEAGGEIKKRGGIKGLGGETKGIYGFSIRTGIGEGPKIQTFGNIKVKEREKKKTEFKITETREPIVDVFDEKDQVRIVAELPGVSEEILKLELKGDILILEAGDEKRKYFKEILLPAKVDFEGMKKNFNNGVLEVKMQKI